MIPYDRKTGRLKARIIQELSKALMIQREKKMSFADTGRECRSGKS